MESDWTTERHASARELAARQEPSACTASALDGALTEIERLQGLLARPSLMAAAVDCELLRHVPPRSDRELLVWAVKRAGHDGLPRPRWAAVSDLLGHGSGVSYALCVAARVDPDEMVGLDPEVDDG